MEANEKQVFIAANHRGGSVTLYLSDNTGQFYVKSLDHVVAFIHRNNFFLDLYEVSCLLKFDFTSLSTLQLLDTSCLSVSWGSISHSNE